MLKLSREASVSISSPKPLSLTLIRAIVVLCGAVASFSSMGCSTVRPQERGMLADPIMQFQAQGGARLRHAIENREGSYGASGVSGGGCGCN